MMRFAPHAAVAAFFLASSALAGLGPGDEGFQAGNRFPEAPLYDLHGDEVRISDFQGRVVLLQLFASW